MNNMWDWVTLQYLFWNSSIYSILKKYKYVRIWKTGRLGYWDTWINNLYNIYLKRMNKYSYGQKIGDMESLL